MKNRIIRLLLLSLLFMVYTISTYGQSVPYYLWIDGYNGVNYTCNPFEDNSGDIQSQVSNTGYYENWKSSHGSPDLHYRSNSATWFAKLEAPAESFETGYEKHSEGIYIPFEFKPDKGYDIQIWWHSVTPNGSNADAVLVALAANGLTEDTDGSCSEELLPNIPNELILSDTPEGFLEEIPFAPLLAEFYEYVPDQAYDYFWLSIYADPFYDTELRIDEITIWEYDIVTGPGGSNNNDDELYVGECDNYYASTNEVLEIGNNYSFYYAGNVSFDNPASFDFTLELFYAGGTYTVISEAGNHADCFPTHVNGWEFTMPIISGDYNWLRNEDGNILGRVYVTAYGDVEDMISVEVIFDTPNTPQLAITSASCIDGITDVSFQTHTEDPDPNLVYTATMTHAGGSITQTSNDGYFTFLDMAACEENNLIEVYVTNSSNQSSETLTYVYNYCENEECYAIPCSEISTFYQVLNGTDFYAYHPSTQTYDLIHTNSYIINAIGYNIEDGLIYGIIESTNHLVKVGSNGVYEDLGEVSGLPIIPNSTGYYIGDFDLSGNLYVTDGQNKVYQIDVSTKQATTININYINFSIQSMQAADFSYLPTTEKFYALNSNSSLISFDPITGNVENLGTTNPTTSCAGFGASYADVDDNLYFFCNATGDLYKVDYNDLSLSLFQDTDQILTKNDGASCVLSSLIQDTCLTIINEDIYCNEAGTVTFSFDFTYNNFNPATNFFIYDSNDMILTNVGGLDLNFGDTYSSVTFDIPTTDSEYCFNIRLFGDTECCHIEYCVDVPICNPCDSISLVQNPVLDEEAEADFCCNEIDVINDFGDNYFTHITSTLITDGVIFSNTLANNGWTVLGTDTELSWLPPSGFVPSGSHYNTMNFCLENTILSSQIPQEVVFDWWGVDTEGNSEIVCSDTLVFDCNLCLIVSDEDTDCISDGTFDYNFTVWNNTNPAHDATDIRIVSLMPSICLDNSEAPAIISLGSTIPQGGNTLINVNISDCGAGLTAGTLIPLKLILLDNDIDLDWCCHVDTLWIQVPDCSDGCGGCDSLTANVDEGYETTRAQHFCIKTFTPLGLQECDSVVWSVDGIPVGSSMGNTPFQYDFGAPSPNYNTCMQVYRTDENGRVCAQIHCKELTIECTEYSIDNYLDINLFPNPVGLNLNYTIKGLGNREIENIEIINTTGEKILIPNIQLRSYSETKSIDVSGINPGAYFIKIYLNDGEELIQRFIKINK